VKLIPEDEAIGKVKDLYDEIKAKLGIGFVPNLYKAMASNPELPGGQARLVARAEARRPSAARGSRCARG
jgi:hypothetical protein